MRDRVFQTTVFSFEPETIALIARMTTPPTLVRKYLINDVIFNLKNSGIWNELDCLWITAAADSQAAILNWKSTDNTLTAVNSPTFVADKGYTSNGTTSYLNTNYNPSTGTTYTLNDASYGVYLRTTTSIASITDMGASVAASSAFSNLNTCNGSSTFSSSVNSNTSGGGVVSNALGLSFSSRIDANNLITYKNGILLDTDAQTTTAIPTVPFYLCAGNATGVAAGFTTRQISMAFTGSGNIDPLNFYYIIQNYMINIGAAV